MVSAGRRWRRWSQTPDCHPGGHLEGRIHVAGGEHPVDVEYVALGLVTGSGMRSGDSEYDSTRDFHRQRATGVPARWLRQSVHRRGLFS
jgi:hypothetical protein